MGLLQRGEDRNSGKAVNSRPVSYTHLDVYKRQDYNNQLQAYRKRMHSC